MPITMQLVPKLGLRLLAFACLCQPLPVLAANHWAEDSAELSNAISSFASSKLQLEPRLDTFRGNAQRIESHPALSRFVALHGNDWVIRWDASSGRPHLIQGAGIPLLPTRTLDRLASAHHTGQISTETIGEIESLARQFLVSQSDLLGIDPGLLRLNPNRSQATDPRRGLWFLEFQQVHQGIPVESANVFVRLTQGRVVQFGTEHFAEVAVPTEPSIQEEDALARALQEMSLQAGELELRKKPELKLFPTLLETSFPWPRHQVTQLGTSQDIYDHLLVWEMLTNPRPDGSVFRIRLDAHSGDLLEVIDLRVFGEAKGQVHDTLANLAFNQPLPYLFVDHNGTQITNHRGQFEYLGGQASASLRGAVINVADGCGPANLTTGNGILDFGGTAGTNCETPAEGGPGNTQAARDAYFYLTNGYQALRDQYPMLSLPGPLNAWTNQPQLQCEASWSESEGSFYFSQGDQECTNIGEVPGILLHEVGHAADSYLGGTASDGASGEAQADFFAFLQTEDACIGRGLRPNSSCQGCSLSCTGVRDLQPFTLGGIAPIASPANLEAPDGLNCGRYACPYQSNPAVQGPLGYQAHCESQIASSALLDLDEKLAALRGNATGRLAMEKLWYTALPSLGQAYRRVNPGQQCVPQNSAVDGCGATNWYSVLLAADDDDGNLANGTPHGCLIWDAFNAHGIACGNSPACYCKGGGTLADAGPDVTICQGEQALLGSPTISHRNYRWQPDGQTTPQIWVSPTSTTEYTVTATDSCGTTSDTAIVHVVACAGFQEDFENGAPGWMTSGLWHAAADTSCVSPPAAQGAGAMYYGIERSCDLETGGPNQGDLVSPPILISAANETLLFDYFLAGISRSPMGRAEVAVKSEGDETWLPRWAVEIGDLSGEVWQTSPLISLRSFRGKTVRLRFSFETYGLAEQSGHYLGWLVDNVRVVEGPAPAADPAPVVTILEAPNGPLSKCDCVGCHFQAIDAEGRDISEIFAWSSDLDGALGAGSRPALLLTPGDHVLTGTVTDYEGRSASRSVAVRIIEDPTNCGLADWPPAEIRLHCGQEEDN